MWSRLVVCASLTKILKSNCYAIVVWGLLYNFCISPTSFYSKDNFRTEVNIKFESRRTFSESRYIWHMIFIWPLFSHLKFSTVSLHFHGICWDSVNLAELIFILPENVLSPLCIANHQLYCLQPSTASMWVNILLYTITLTKGEKSKKDFINDKKLVLLEVDWRQAMGMVHLLQGDV